MNQLEKQIEERLKGRKIQKRSERCWIVTLGISFNVKDPHQFQLFELADDMVNFSAAAKRWLEREIHGTNQQLIPQVRIQQTEPLNQDITKIEVRSIVTEEEPQTQIDDATAFF